MKIAILAIDRHEGLIDQDIHIGTEIAYIINSLENNNFDDIVFAASNIAFLNLFKPEVICIYAPYSETFEYINNVSNKIKKQYNAPVILLGDHISSLPRTLPITCDVGILGDSEEILVKVIELIRNNNFDEKYLSKISGLVFHSKTRKIITSPPQYIENIESLSLTRAVFYQSPGKWITSIISGRGKPSNNDWDVLTNQPVRLFSIEKMMRDIADIIANNKEEKIVPIKDCLFLYDKDRFKKFVAMYRETKLSQYMHFEINSMIYQLDEEIIHDLKKILNIPKLTINFLSPIEKPYKEMKERFIPYKEQQKILDLCFKYNLNVDANFMYNLPLETTEDITKIYWLIKRDYLKKYNNLNLSVKPYISLPGSKNWQKMFAKKVITESFNNWESLKKYSESTPSLNSIKNTDILLINETFNKLTSRPDDNFILNLEQTSKTTEMMKENMSNMISKFKDHLSKNPVENIDVNNITNTFFDDNQRHIKLSDNILNHLEDINDFNPEKGYKDIQDKIENIRAGYYSIHDDYLYHKLHNSNSITYLSLNSVLEQITKNTNIKSVLQVSNQSILDLKKVFKNDYLDVDYLDTVYFNKPTFNNKLDKQYDMILLYFTANNVLDFKKTLRFCHNNLKDNGLLVVPFFHSKNLLDLIRITTNLNTNDWIYNYKRTNLHTILSMNDDLTESGFMIKNVDGIDFPNINKPSINAKVFYSFLDKNLTTFEMEKYMYIYTCRKKS